MLLEILGQASNSHNIQPHLLSLFDNTAKLIYFESEYDKVKDIVSKEGEKIPLEHPVLCTGGVENWLNTLLNESKFSVNQIIANVYNYIMTDVTFSIITMVETFPAQVRIYFKYVRFRNLIYLYHCSKTDGSRWPTTSVDNSYRICS